MQKQQLGSSDDDSGREPRSAVQRSDEAGDTTTTTVPPVVAGKAVKQWSFTELRGDALDPVEIASGIQVGGLLNEIHDYGPTFRDSDVFFPDETSRPPDGIATGQITSFEDDVTYWVGAEAPAGIAALPDAPIGSVSTLRLTQSFIKRSDDASLSLTLSAALIETTDLNAFLARECPAGHSYGLVCDLIKGELYVNVAAFTVPRRRTSSRSTSSSRSPGAPGSSGTRRTGAAARSPPATPTSRSGRSRTSTSSSTSSTAPPRAWSS